MAAFPLIPGRWRWQGILRRMLAVTAVAWLLVVGLAQTGRPPRNPAPLARAQASLKMAGPAALAPPAAANAPLPTGKTVAPVGWVYQIRPGDTLWWLARQWKVTVRDLELANNLSGDRIVAGYYLVVPDVYSVQPGDTLGSVASKFGVSQQTLGQENRLASDQLSPGQTLVIPYLGPLPDADDAPASASPGLASRGLSSVSSGEVLSLARLVQAEAGNQPFAGQVAVAAVVLNRLAAPGFPKTVQAVVFQPGQFASVANGQYWETPSPLAFAAVKAALAGWDPTGGALFFYNPSLPHSPWMDTLPQSAVIGAQVFCR